jgi:hypothetical protein
MSSRKSRWPELCILLGVFVLAASLVVPGLFIKTRIPFESGAAAKLKVIASAQRDFRDNDRDGSGATRYWRKDIAGLHAIKGKDGKPIDLIPKSFALADDRPQPENQLAPTPPHCDYYRFRALRFGDEKTPDPNRWAACAVPGREGDCRYVFIISHDNIVFRKFADQVRNLELYPADPPKEGWTRMD